MSDIKKLICDSIEELMDAEAYAKCALAHKDSDKNLADMYYNIAVDQMKHHQMEHTQIDRLISNQEPDHEWMRTVWNFEKTRMIDWKAKINAMLTMYKP